MKTYNITVNGTTYEVQVEEVGTSSQAVSEAVKPAPAAPAPAAKPAAPTPPKAEPAAPKASAGSGNLTCPMPGTVLDILVKAGDSFKKGDVLLILEAMKMENEIMAADDGKVVSVVTSKGASVNSGDVLLELE